MTYTGEFTVEDEKFIFEPPIETGHHVINSLGKLAAVAAIGYDANLQEIEKTAQETDRTLGLLYTSNGIRSFPQYLTNVASRSTDHTVFISKY
jgi:hypothetical protein